VNNVSENKENFGVVNFRLWYSTYWVP